MLYRRLIAFVYLFGFIFGSFVSMHSVYAVDFNVRDWVLKTSILDKEKQGLVVRPGGAVPQQAKSFITSVPETAAVIF